MIFQDEHSPVAESVFNALSAEELTGIVQPLFYQEITNTLVLVARKNRISLAEFDTYLEVLLDLPFEQSDYSTGPTGLVETVRWAQEYRLTVYDASYLALAVHKNNRRSSPCRCRGSVRVAFYQLVYFFQNQVRNIKNVKYIDVI